MNVLTPNLRISIQTLLEAGKAQREITHVIGVDPKTVRRVARESKSPGVATGICVEKAAFPVENPPPRPPAPAPTPSACERHRDWIEAQITLGRNAMSVYQDLVEQHGFTHAYNSVKRFVARLKACEPEHFDMIDALPGEEAQVDFDEGAPTRQANGKYRRPYLFVMTLKYSGKSFRKVVWKADQQSWARLHEEAFWAFNGSVQYVVLDNLKQGVIRPDLYEPAINSVYGAVLAHYGAVADAARVADPNRKWTVENAIQHPQSTALKGRKFESIEEKNLWLAHCEDRWAAPRIHGQKKRQVLAMFAEEKPALRALLAERFRYFRESSHTVDDSGLVQVLRSYYAAIPAAPRGHRHRPGLRSRCRDLRRRRFFTATPSSIQSARTLRDGRVGSDLQPLARNGAPVGESREARAPQPHARARHLPALRPDRPKSALWHDELTASLRQSAGC